MKETQQEQTAVPMSERERLFRKVYQEMLGTRLPATTVLSSSPSRNEWMFFNAGADSVEFKND